MTLKRCCKLCLLLMACVTFTPLAAQVSDTLAENITVQTAVRNHSPEKAIAFSAVLPGLGQVYNNKPWKVPIIYGAGGTLVYFIHHNHIRYVKFRDAYINTPEGEPAFFFGRTYEYVNLARGRDFYRRRRDLSVIGLGLIYFLNIVDAMVDAHFFYYDVSDDLSFSIEPVMIDDLTFPSSLGLTFRIGF